MIPRAIEAARGGRPIGVFGEDYPTPDGTCLRDYVHVVDLAEAHLKGLQRLEQGGASATYNVGTERPSSVRDVIVAVEKVTGFTSRSTRPRVVPEIRRCSMPRPNASGRSLAGRPCGPSSR